MQGLELIMPLVIGILSVVCVVLVIRVFYQQYQINELIDWLKEDSDLINQLDSRLAQLERPASETWNTPQPEPSTLRGRFFKPTKRRSIRS